MPPCWWGSEDGVWGQSEVGETGKEAAGGLGERCGVPDTAGRGGGGWGLQPALPTSGERGQGSDSSWGRIYQELRGHCGRRTSSCSVSGAADGARASGLRTDQAGGGVLLPVRPQEPQQQSAGSSRKVFAVCSQDPVVPLRPAPAIPALWSMSLSPFPFCSAPPPRPPPTSRLPPTSRPPAVHEWRLDLKKATVKLSSWARWRIFNVVTFLLILYTSHVSPINISICLLRHRFLCKRIWPFLTPDTLLRLPPNRWLRGSKAFCFLR